MFLIYWSVKILTDLPLERYFKKVRFYHILLPALVLASFAFVPAKLILDLLFSFPIGFGGAWIPPLIKFFEGVGFVVLLVYLLRGYKVPGGKISRLEELTQVVVEKAKRTRRPKLGKTHLMAIGLVLIVLGGIYYFLSSRGYIIRFSLFRPEYLEYRSGSPQFSFSYPSRFVVDQDEENRFGEDYHVGIKLPSDNRVGCDVRSIKGELNIKGELDPVTAKLAQEISQGAEDFKVLDSSFLTVGEERAIKLAVSFRGPLEETMRTDQIFTSHQGRVYTLMCGTSKDTYEFFAEDFNHFFENFSWEEREVSF